ncbi:hypothetical protein [Salipiger mucosus]|nr:hypothetical protein [Salipiger mucosus]
MSQPMPQDGTYYAERGNVFRSPTKTDTGFKMGFKVCVVSDGLNEGAAAEIADALNLHMQHHPDKH